MDFIERKGDERTETRLLSRGVFAATRRSNFAIKRRLSIVSMERVNFNTQNPMNGKWENEKAQIKEGAPFFIFNKRTSNVT